MAAVSDLSPTRGVALGPLRDAAAAAVIGMLEADPSLKEWLLGASPGGGDWTRTKQLLLDALKVWIAVRRECTIVHLHTFTSFECSECDALLAELVCDTRGR